LLTICYITTGVYAFVIFMIDCKHGDESQVLITYVRFNALLLAYIEFLKVDSVFLCCTKS